MEYDEVVGRVEEPIASQEEADQVEARLAALQAVPPAEISPLLEELMVRETERLAAWEASHG
jgi:hypothetical protein